MRETHRRLRAANLSLAALDHALVATPGIVGWYKRNLDRGINVARWLEYSLSASLMIVLIERLGFAQESQASPPPPAGADSS